MNRAQMLYALTEIIDAAKEAKNKDGKTTPVIFVPKVKNISDEEKGEDEYEALGYFISHNPLDKFKHTLLNLCPIVNLETKPENSQVVLGGLITNLKEITTKSKKQMAFFDLEDFTGRVEVVAFTNIYKKNIHLFQKNKPVRISGKLEVQTREINGEEISSFKIILMSIQELTVEKKIQKIVLYPTDNSNLEEIYDLLTTNPGTIPIEIEYKRAVLKTNHKIILDKNVLDKLECSCATRRIYGN